MSKALLFSIALIWVTSSSCMAEDDELQLCVNRCGFENNGQVGSKPYDKCIAKCPGARELMRKERIRRQREGSSQDSHPNKLAGNNSFCGRISSLPDGFALHESGKSDIFFAGDNSAPPDPKKVYEFLNTRHPDSDRGCYCIKGVVEKGEYGRRFSYVAGLKRCRGDVTEIAGSANPQDATGPTSAESCETFYQQRNRIYKKAGSCFKTRRAIASLEMPAVGST